MARLNRQNMYTIRIALALIVVILVSNVVSTGIVTRVVMEHNGRLSQESVKKLESIEYANSFRESVDTLTNSLMRLGVTKSEYYGQYFLDEIFEKKNIEQAVNDLKDLGLSEDAYGYIYLANLHSETLLERELWALRMLYEGAGFKPLPAILRSVKLPPEDKVLSKEAKVEKAQVFIFGEQYDRMNTKVNDNLEKFYDTLVLEMRILNEKTLEDSNRAIMVQNIINILGLLLLVLVLISLYQMLVKPIQGYSNILMSSSPTKGKVYLEPIGGKETIALAKAFNQNMEQIDHAQEQLLQANQELERINNTDYLTELPNRQFILRYIQELLKDEKKRAHVAVAIFDLDRFKLLNDTYGHPVGDYVLQKVAKKAFHSMEKYDATVSRIGGEEFLVVFPFVTQKGLHLAMEELVEEIAKLDIKKDDLEGVKTTISVGSYWNKKSHACVDVIYSFADQALYEAKKTGRNKHVEFEEEVH